MDKKTRSQELRAQRADLIKKRGEALTAAGAILDKAKAESREVTDEERTAHQGHVDAVDQIDRDLEALEGRIKAEERQESLESSLGGDPPRPEPAKAPAGHVKSTEPYSLMRALRACVSGDFSEAKVEKRASDEINEALEREPSHPKALTIPYRHLLPIDVEQRVVAKAAPNTSGAALVPTELMPDEFIELLRNETRVVQAGARMLPNLMGDVDLPRQATGASAAFVADEDTAVAESTLTTDLVSLRPKTVGLKSTVTRRMLKQSALGIEELVRGDIRQAIGIAIDAAALTGSGAGGNPTGIINTAGIGGVTTTGAITRVHIVEFESDLETANALRGRLSFFMRSAVKGILRRKESATNTGIWLMADDGTVLGYASQVTEQMPANNLLYGNFQELLIGMWGGLDVFADPYTVGDKGHVVIRGFQDIDIAVRHAASFSLATDVTG